MSKQERSGRHQRAVSKEDVAMDEQRQYDASVPLISSQPTRVTWAGLVQLVELSPDALVLVDQTGNIVMANEQVVALFGYQLQEVLGQRLELFLSTRLRALHIAH